MDSHLTCITLGVLLLTSEASISSCLCTFSVRTSAYPLSAPFRPTPLVRLCLNACPSPSVPRSDVVRVLRRGGLCLINVIAQRDMLRVVARRCEGAFSRPARRGSFLRFTLAFFCFFGLLFIYFTPPFYFCPQCGGARLGSQLRFFRLHGRGSTAEVRDKN